VRVGADQREARGHAVLFSANINEAVTDSAIQDGGICAAVQGIKMQEFRGFAPTSIISLSHVRKLADYSH